MMGMQIATMSWKRELTSVLAVALALLVAATLLAGCAGLAPRQTVRELRPDFDGSVIHRSSGNLVGSNGKAFDAFSTGPSIYLNVQRATNKDGVHSFDLIVHYEFKDWMFIAGGASLNLLIDGESLTLSMPQGIVPGREVITSSMVWETAYYPVTPEQLQRIANASTVLLKLHGGRGYLDRKLTAWNIANIREFADKYVAASEAEALSE
jgi:hypothetical protein